MTELASPNGVADVIAIELARSWQAHIRIAEIPSRWLYALHRLPHRVMFSVEYFSDFTNVSRSHAVEVLKVYAQSGYCEFIEDKGSCIKLKEPETIAKGIVAIEAKLRDWRRALYQASRYADYAWESWVVLDYRSVEPAVRHIDEFERLGIGLAGFSSDGDIEIFNSASRKSPRLPFRFWYANCEIAKRLTSSL